MVKEILKRCLEIDKLTENEISLLRDELFNEQIQYQYDRDTIESYIEGYIESVQLTREILGK